jgi:hypothetical protein
MRVELKVRFRVDIRLYWSHWDNVADLRTYPDDARFEGAQLGYATTIGTDLLVEVANRSYEKLL